MIVSFRGAWSSADAEHMWYEWVVIDLCMACVVASLLSIAVFFVVSAGVAAKTVADARRRARRTPPYLGQMSRWCSVGELAQVDEALDQVLAEERAAAPGLSSR